MRNPFTSIPESKKQNVVEAWLAAGAVENKPSAWDLLAYEDEWGIYTLGQVRRLAELAEVALEVPPLELGTLLHSAAITETMQETWILGVQSANDVYVGLILEYLESTQQGEVGDA